MENVLNALNDDGANSALDGLIWRAQLLLEEQLFLESWKWYIHPMVAREGGEMQACDCQMLCCRDESFIFMLSQLILQNKCIISNICRPNIDIL